MKFEVKTASADVIVVGAGVAGICAALESARNGAKTILINDRGVVGGNNSAEIFVSLDGSNDGSQINLNSREGGIVEEIREETKFRSVTNNRYAMDSVLMDLIYGEENLTLYLNTCIDEAVTDESGKITSVSGTQNTTETRWIFYGKWFIDDTGDGALGALAGAKFMLGREAKSTFNEQIAPDKADKFCLPSTMSFYAKDTGSPVKYIAPKYADDIPASGALKYRTIPHQGFHSMKWYYEVTGELDQVKDREEIIRRHRGLVSGIWNYIKNSGKYPEAENYDLEYVSNIPGMREYRRLNGDYILTEHDIVDQHEHDDAVGHGGWNIDLHAIRGFYDTDLINRHIHFQGVYQIPYRCGYSENVVNMFMCGRCMSTSHVAFGSTRVAATLSTLGQAVGMAAAMCKQYDIMPRDIYENHRKELQQRLLRDDQLILNLKNQDPNDKALSAKITASSVMPFELNSETASFTPMWEGVALCIPVADKLESIDITVDAANDTKLSYKIYKPFKPYNYGPDELISEKSVDVPKQKGTITIPIGITEGGLYYFIEFIKNDDIQLMTCENKLPTTMMYRRNINKGATIWDYREMKMRDVSWSRTQLCMVFSTSPAQHLYEPQNINNGYNRACGSPNMWMCNSDDKRPEITLSWDKPVDLSMVQITFYVDTTLIIHHYRKSMLSGIATDYKIYGINGDKETLLVDVTDNHQKFNRHKFDPTICDKIKIKFEKSVDDEPVGIYEIRAE